MSGNITFRNNSPEQLDRMIRVAGPGGWIVLAVLLLVLVVGLGWSVVSMANIKVPGRGILQTSGGLTQLVAPDAGTVASVEARLGQRVAAGDLLVRLAQPALDVKRDSLRGRREMLENERQRLIGFNQKEQELRLAADTERRSGLDQSLATLFAQEQALQESVASQRRLLERGVTSRDRVLSVEADLAGVRRDIATLRDNLQSLGLDANERRVRFEQALMEVDSKIAATTQEIAEVEAEITVRSDVRAPTSGRVVELAVETGDRVAAGSSLLRIAPDGSDGLSALIYVSSGDGKKITPGMTVQVVPSTVRMEREGFILAEVVSVSEIPATREAVLRRLVNAALVDTLLANGPPFEVQVRLRPDPQTVSGFAWSTDLGRTRAVEGGTSVDAQIVVGRVRVLALVFPQVDRLLHWLGLDG
ncbi:NHLP bacteriocin system secretion protein [Rhizobium sp. RU36D]|uniref:NHLP bacteriocin system secretion protein n=1 Tax=Rhizobium sp. RU36D TaxID=1907415 RepID=UPI0009D81884|nr:NHLP bacteriocin system secretion protein [Rhizobium sp. RU36D]SMC70492.1 HlyD family secretion protein [Rhizobium sp. RU36D]